MAQGLVGKIADRLGRDVSTISPEIRRNAAALSSGFVYRATTAQWHAKRSARRPNVAKLAVNATLGSYVQDRLAGIIVSPSGKAVHGPTVAWNGRRHGRRHPKRSIRLSTCKAGARCAARSPHPSRATRAPDSDVSGISAKLSRVKSSTTARMRKHRPSVKASETKSSTHWDCSATRSARARPAPACDRPVCAPEASPRDRGDGSACGSWRALLGSSTDAIDGSRSDASSARRPRSCIDERSTPIV